MNYLAFLKELLSKLKPEVSIMIVLMLGAIAYLALELNKSNLKSDSIKTTQLSEYIDRIHKLEIKLETCEKAQSAINQKVDSIYFRMVEYKIELEILKKLK